jgi:hypothetical protein
MTTRCDRVSGPDLSPGYSVSRNSRSRCERCGCRLTTVEPEPQPEDLLLALGQLAEHVADRFGEHHAGRRVGGTVGRRVLDEVGEIRLVLLADR